VAPDSWRNEKVKADHLERLAMVYVRQSTLYQVQNNRESTEVQYGLKDLVCSLGWRPERVRVVDQDLAQSAQWVEGRQGFQNLVAEVSLGHVGIIVGMQMSRLGRSCAPWYQLLDLCALHGTLLADLDGVYDPSQYSDRLVLGLKGTMSEVESHMINQRMKEGRLNKARRGDLVSHVPVGYIRRPSGEVIIDPDEQVQDVVRLIFRKFSELRTQNAVLRYMVDNGIQIGVRVHSGSGRGDLEWRRPCRPTLNNLLHNPMYAGAYAYLRRPTDRRRQKPGRRSTGRTVAPRDNWIVIKDRMPAYITWEQYEDNQAILAANRTTGLQARGGAPRQGSALLSGLLICGRCGHRMVVHYSQGCAQYACERLAVDYGLPRCQRLSGRRLDDFVVAKLLEILTPASIELSLQAATVLEDDRAEAHRIWKQRLERLRYEADRTARQYRAVEPENRLVGRSLEKEWEAKLTDLQTLQEEYDRFAADRPRLLTQAERERIRCLANDIPRIWAAASTTAEEKKSILRELVQAVRIVVADDSERVDIEIEWVGSDKTTGEIKRAVATWDQVSRLPELLDRMRQLFAEGKSYKETANQLHEEGWRPPKRSARLGYQSVKQLAQRWGLQGPKFELKQRPIERSAGEWTVIELAAKLQMPHITLHAWLYRGWLQARKEAGSRGRWLIRADEIELERLRALRRRTPGQTNREKWLRGQGEPADPAPQSRPKPRGTST
jgi:DNA invertase Pin-like site-specific DNA recombinase